MKRAICGAFVLLIAAAAAAEDCPQLVGQWTYGPASAVAVEGDRALFASGTVLMVADVSDPDAPIVIGELPLLERPQRIDIVGERAYVASRTSFWYNGGALTVVDLSTPAQPELLGRYTHFCNAEDVVVRDGLAFVATYCHSHFSVPGGGLLVFDVSGPGDPVLLGRGPDLHADAVALGDDHAYVVGSGLQVFDISDPRHPRIVSTLDVSSPNAIALRGNTFFLADDRDGLLVVDVSRPRSPVVAASYPIPREEAIRQVLR